MVRCLESIIRQDYKNVEVIISDDTPGEDIKQAVEGYKDRVEIKYYHNQPSLGSPKNWNAALDKGSGEFLLLLHQDDWFHAPNALSLFLKEFLPGVDFVFCRNTAIDEEGNEKILQAIPRLLKEMAEKPNQLVLAQVIGPPSNTMIRKYVDTRYDERFIWLVDVDYYSRMLKAGYKYRYIDQHLVSIGLHEDQTTVFCRNNADIIFKENIWFANKMGSDAFKDLLIYDYYWRLLRNYKIRSIIDIEANKVAVGEIPPVIMHMLSFQKKLPFSLLKIGAASKILMVMNYSSWKRKLRS